VPGRTWTIEEADAALPRVLTLLQRIRALAVETRRERAASSDRAGGNGHDTTDRPSSALRAAVDELTSDGIILRDLDAGLVDFPAELPDGRIYLLCWVAGEPEVAWWHWPDTGFAGRRPLTDPPGSPGTGPPP
jgi:hypothetical protein